MLLESSGNDLGGKVEVLAEVVNALRGEDIVVVLPREVGSEETPRGQRLASLDDEQVLDVEVLVLGSVEVLLGDEDTLLEEVLVDDAPIGLGNDHAGLLRG